MINKGAVMKSFKVLLLVFLASLLVISCTKGKADSRENAPKYTQSDVRNRNLKTAIEDYNNGFYKAADTSIGQAQRQSLRDEDIVILKDLDRMIENKTLSALKSLDSLAVKEKLHLYDFQYNTITNNYDIGSFRHQVEDSKARYLERVKSENDSYLKNYYSLIDQLKEFTNVKTEGPAMLYHSQTSPLKLFIKVDGYNSPGLFLAFYPSQLETELETVKFSSSDISIFFDKGSMIISDYNLSTIKTITFNLLNDESKLNITNFKQMLEDANIAIDLKWFYEPEKVTISKNDIKQLQQVMTTFEKIEAEYKANIDNIYVPKHVK